MTTKQIIVGMPGSGKTTFLAALRYLLVSGEVQTSLKLLRLSESEKHLNEIEKSWISCEAVARTRGAANEWVVFHVRDSETGEESDLTLPDLSGEAFREPASRGVIRRPVYDALGKADGWALFTNADRGSDDDLICDLSEVIDFLEAGTHTPNSGAASVEVDDHEGVAFNPDEMPEEAKLVELLQIINRRPLVPRERRLAVIISAWDVVADDGLTPDQWFERKRPMLHQFLKFNRPYWEFRVYGVSAQGGVLPRDRAQLQELSNPTERIKIVAPGVLPHDLSTPIRWLMRK